VLRLGVLASVALVGLEARAAGDDAAMRAALQRVMTEQYPANLGAAKKALNEQLSACLRSGCATPLRSDLYIALGMVSSQLGEAEEAKQHFRTALRSVPSASLPPLSSAITVTPTIKSQFAEVVASLPPSTQAGLGVSSPVSSASASSDKADKAEADVGLSTEPFGAAGALQLMLDALKADKEGRLEECIAKNRAALKIDEQPRARLHLASCESRSGKLVDALKDTQKALEQGLTKRDAAVMKVARQRIAELLDRMPHVTFVSPAGVSGLSVTFDDRPVPIDALSKRFSIDPGKHRVVAEGVVNGLAATFQEDYDVQEKEILTIRITLKPQATAFITPGQIQCMLGAKSQEEVQKCLPQTHKNVVVRAGADLSGYVDTNSVAVYTPGINVSVLSPTAGWNVGGNFLVDAVSAASPDILSSASPPFEEFRYSGGVTGGYKPGRYGVQASANSSWSPDYASYTGGARFIADFNDKLITPSLGYSFSRDSVGRGPNNFQRDFNPLKGRFDTHEIEASVTFVLSARSVLLVGATAQFERGDQSQPYRYVPMFAAGTVAPLVPVGASVGLVNRSRLPIRPLEQLPTERDRFALAARFNTRLGSSMTLRMDERVYRDSWDLRASSTDMRLMVDLSSRLRVWPHLRFHAQSGTSFYQLAYAATLESTAPVALPLYRTGDRELSPLLTGTGGGGVRVALGDPEGEARYGITFVADAMYTRYFRALYVTSRVAVYGSLGFDVEF